jgi:hypothetical protein
LKDAIIHPTEALIPSDVYNYYVYVICSLSQELIELHKDLVLQYFAELHAKPPLRLLRIDLVEEPMTFQILSFEEIHAEWERGYCMNAMTDEFKSASALTGMVAYATIGNDFPTVIAIKIPQS